MKRWVLYMALGVLLSACRKGPVLSLQGANEDRVVAILPIGTVDSSQVAHLRRYIERFFNVQAILLEPVAAPENALLHRESGLSADAVLAHLEEKRPLAVDLIVGFTHSDIFTNNEKSGKSDAAPDWKGVFGLSYVAAGAAVISDARLKTVFGNGLFTTRLYTVLLHEMGHMLGLPHCSEKRCAMSETNGALSILDKGLSASCRRCRQQLD